MRKLAIFIGIAVGFILGSCAGRAPYEKLQERVTRLRQKPEVQDTVAAMREEAARRARELARQGHIQGPFAFGCTSLTPWRAAPELGRSAR